MAKRDICFSVDDAVRLIGRLVDTAYPPDRMTDNELRRLLDSFNDLLTQHPEFHRRDGRFFVFHQQLITEHDQRLAVDEVPLERISKQLDFNDIAGPFGVEVAY